ncbi:2-isopropylmalate synthase [Rickenella mellea]|uniref:2-isopropylmalate synthase n=1 Tax=Rickenella mellea TaxID=50990 RepID=A0A4Y7Q3H4_9AGAM|nr:2-isopropylmalate synthase [Rickenella mellea]
MPMLSDPSTKYTPYPPVPFPPNYNRKWPTGRITVAPTWLSTDLRDGNQALVNPMSNATKLELFRLLVKIGFKEIEVAYPAASDLEYDFVRSLIENNEVPDDVSLQVITPAIPALIARSIASLAGAKKAIVHLYNAVSPVFREVVFRNSREATVNLTLEAVRTVKKLTEETMATHGGHFRLNYCLETFSQTEADFAVELGNKVLQEWGKIGPGDDRVTFNLAATVECGPPNHYADMVEYFSNNISNRENVIISIHPHNDRGCGVAATELALLAGGTRVEGCLLGNGERTGNVDIITLALNMYTQGVAPHLDFSDLKSIVSVVERCNEMTVSPRYPYAGELVYSAFAGTHQDAIKKGFDAQDKRWAQADAEGDRQKLWKMPYIPIDPADLGYGYDNLIRVSSQSGKSGAAYVVKRTLGLDMPRRMQVDFYKVVQAESDRTGKEMTAKLLAELFETTYLFSRQDNLGTGRLKLCSFKLFRVTSEPSSPLSECSEDQVSGSESDSQLRFVGNILVDDKLHVVQGEGPTALHAIVDALQHHLDLHVNTKEFATNTIATNSPANANDIASFIEIEYQTTSGGNMKHWGVGVSSDSTTSKLRAVISAVNTAVGERSLPKPKAVFRLKAVPVRADTGLEDLSGLNMRTGHFVRRSEELDSRRRAEASV